MAKIKIEEIIDYLDTDIRWALEQTIKQHFPDEEFNAFDVFRTFKRSVDRKCSTWESVPDRYIIKD